MADLIIIDDDATLREVLTTALTQSGHTVRQAGDGDAGIRLYRQRPADLVITDIVMPDKEGLDTIIELRRDYPTARIIAMSGGLAHDPKLYLHMAEKLGARLVLYKPFSLAELFEAIDNALAK